MQRDARASWLVPKPMAPRRRRTMPTDDPWSTQSTRCSYSTQRARTRPRTQTRAGARSLVRCRAGVVCLFACLFACLFLCLLRADSSSVSASFPRPFRVSGAPFAPPRAAPRRPAGCGTAHALSVPPVGAAALLWVRVPLRGGAAQLIRRHQRRARELRQVLFGAHGYSPGTLGGSTVLTGTRGYSSGYASVLSVLAGTSRSSVRRMHGCSQVRP
jgi:hypothetical protein